VTSPKKRRGWLHIACTDTVMRDQLRLIPTAMIGQSALDVLDALMDIIDRQEAADAALIAGDDRG
jgi:hypothetical protein